MQSLNNLVWIDLEMTGLDVNDDHILEAAAVITSQDLEIIAYGPHCIIHQSDSVLDAMNQWCIKQHSLSGLTQAVKDSKTTLDDAQQALYNFVQEYCIPGKAVMCGNSIWQDKAFIAKHMPKLNSLFHYKIIDVSSIKELIIRWYPENPYASFKKRETHRALEDILESINQLENYKTHFFMSSP